MNLLFLGSKSFFRTAMALADECGLGCVGAIDDVEVGPGILGTLDQVAISHPTGAYAVVIAIGYNDLAARWAAIQKVKAKGYATPALIHPQALVAPTARIGEGALIMRGAIVDVAATIGSFAVLWPGACVNHDSVIGANTFLSPNAVVCGNAQIGAHCFIGANAAVVDGAQLADGTRLNMHTGYTRRAR